MFRRFAAAWRFLTIFPLPFWQGADEGERLARSPGTFPAVGLVLGIGVTAVAAFAGRFLPETATAALMVTLLAYPSGALHLDGLADSADGLLSPGRDREKALAVMKDSRIGAHGAVALVLILLLKYACLASLALPDLLATLVVVPLAGRAAMLFPMAMLPYAREKGLGGLFVFGNRATAPLLAMLWTICAMLAFWGVFEAVVGVTAWLTATLLWVWFLKARLGGATGDSYGATCEIAETVVCLAAAGLLQS